MSDALKEISEAIYMLDHNKITIGEYKEKLKPWHDAEPIRHGQWLWVDGVRCSICNHKLQTTGLPSYCPNCGAKMDEVAE